MNTASAPRRLTRSSSDRMLGGVAAGVGDYFGIDPNLVRVGFVVGSALSGAGVLAYLLLLIVLPGDDGEPAAFGPRPSAA